MNEEHLSIVRQRLERRKNGLTTARASFFHPRLRRFWAFLTTDPWLSTIARELEQDSTGQNTAKDISMNATHTIRNREILAGLTEDQLAAVAYHLLRLVADHPDTLNRIAEGTWEAQPGHVQDYATFNNELILPLFDYLDDKLDDQQAVLGLLVRYKKRCEWFNREDLFQIADDQEANKGDGKKQAAVEDALKADLYRYLHDQGVEFTIEPSSPRGKIDLILDQKVANRKHLEVKVFDNVRRNAKYIIKGFGQLLHYLRHYNSSVGYLLVYKTCEEQLVFPDAEPMGEVRFVRCEGRTIYLLTADICPHEESVSERDYQPVLIMADELRKVKAD